MEKTLYQRVKPEDFETDEKEDLPGNKGIDKNVHFDNPVVITERRKERNLARVVEKGSLQAQYHRNAMIVDEAFEVIKINSGINNIDEIVTTFLKSEE